MISSDVRVGSGFAPTIEEISPPGVKPHDPSGAELPPQMAWPMRPPTSDPIIPSTDVASQPMGWLPG